MLNPAGEHCAQIALMEPSFLCYFRLIILSVAKVTRFDLLFSRSDDGLNRIQW